MQPAGKTNPFPDKVWVCWLQGIDQAPEVVKKCVETIYKHAGRHGEVVVLSEKNMSDYIQMPDDLLEMVEKRDYFQYSFFRSVAPGSFG